MTINAERVDEILMDSLYGAPDDGRPDALCVEGLVRTFLFSKSKVETYKGEIKEMLDQLPAQFHNATGGGGSFLNMCVDLSGAQWGEHRNMEALCCLAIAVGYGTWGLKSMMEILPGGVPYFSVDTEGG